MPTPLVTPASATVHEPSASPDEDDGGALMRTYLAEQPALTDPQRAAFTRQCTAEKADELGRRTKAMNVLRDSERFAKVMRAALPAPRGGLAYSKPRFRFYLEALLDLRDHIAKDGERSLTQNDAGGSLRTRLGTARRRCAARAPSHFPSVQRGCVRATIPTKTSRMHRTVTSSRPGNRSRRQRTAAVLQRAWSVHGRSERDGMLGWARPVRSRPQRLCRNAVLAHRRAFFVEAKEVSRKLTGYDEQLADYFAKDPTVKIGILTNGAQWRFFTDMTNENVMDKEPFARWDVLSDDAPPYDVITLMQKSQFNAELVRAYAQRQKRVSEVVNGLTILLEPASEFTKLAIQSLETRKVTEAVVKEWKPIVAGALNEWARQRMLAAALATPQPGPVRTEMKADAAARTEPKGDTAGRAETKGDAASGPGAAAQTAELSKDGTVTTPDAGGAKRPPAEIATLTEKLCDYIKANPGLGIEAIGKALATATSELTLPVRKLLGANRIRFEGERRGTKYFPM